MRQNLLRFFIPFTISAGMWMLIEYADDKQLSEADFWFSIGFGFFNVLIANVAGRLISWWEKRREA